MVRTRVLFAVVVGVAAAGLALAGDAPVPLALAQGVVEKVEKDSLTVKPRGTDGRFQKSVVLKVTGTSNVTIITQRKGKGTNAVLVQKSAAAKDLETGQHVAIIYAPEKGGGVLLSAVAQPAKAP